MPSPHSAAAAAAAPAPAPAPAPHDDDRSRSSSRAPSAFIAPSVSYYAAAAPGRPRTPPGAGPTAAARRPSNGRSNARDPHYNLDTRTAAAAPDFHPSFAQRQQLQAAAVAAAASLPRTSSLLPPARPPPDPSTPPAAYRDNPFDAPAAALRPSPDRYADAVNLDDDDLSPRGTSRRRQSRPHSRASSLGGFSDSFRNLNRWSASTASSRASNVFHHQKQGSGNSATRRLSVDSVALAAASPSLPGPPVNGSPRKLQKSRPSTSGDSPRSAAAAAARVRQQSAPHIAAFTSLPPIVTLPSLEQEVRSDSPAMSAQAENQRAPYFRRPSAEPTTGYYWDDPSAATPADKLPYSSRVDTPDSAFPGSNSRNEAGAAMYGNADGDQLRDGSHARSRSHAAKGSTDAAMGQKSRSKTPSQKATLSRALQKANTAVQLDNAQNFEGARQAYAEACDLLHQVLVRTSGEEDKRKLEAIRKTYTSRIEELDLLLPADSGEETKALPQRPQSNETGSTFEANDDVRERSGAATAMSTRTYTESERQQQQAAVSYSVPISAARRQLNPRPESAMRAETPQMRSTTNATSQFSTQSPFTRGPSRSDSRLAEVEVQMPPSMGNLYMPPPLSPRKPMSPAPERTGNDATNRTDATGQARGTTPDQGQARGHARGGSHESTSWLDPIDESGGSSASSVHSRTSSMHIRRKHIRAASGDTEAEFDAALDDAIEAAYDDSYEPMHDAAPRRQYDDDDDGDDIVAKALQRVEAAKERVRQSEMEVRKLAEDRERKRLEALREEQQSRATGFYDGNSSDEEEHALEGMSDGYGIEDFVFGKKKKAAPRDRGSDSSEFTPRTWNSSTASNPQTATTLATVNEDATVTPLGPPSMPPPPAQALPKLPTQRPDSAAGRQTPVHNKSESVRDRRLSGQKPKELKIETAKLGPAPSIQPQPAPAGAAPPPPTNGRGASQQKAAGYIVQQRQALSAGPTRGPHPFRGPSPGPGDPGDMSPPTPPIPQGFLNEARAESPSVARPGLRKNFSASSLKSLKGRNFSISNIDNIDEVTDMSPVTPSLGTTPSGARFPAMPSLPTPIAAAFKERLNAGSAASHFNIFDSDIHSPSSPGAPNPLMGADENAPVPLEPCPTDVMLRPFWLMRALYQTLAHPRGGYVSNKLFVPRDAWRVKGVKLRGVEDKIAQCDLLTAALQKLGRVDTFDADAVLEEMQSLEGVLEQVQSSLARRLGSEVGVHSAAAMFKEADVGSSDGVSGFATGGGPGGGAGGAGAGAQPPRSGSVSGKPGAFSWRRLRSKNSSMGMSNTYDRGQGRSSSGSAGAAGAGGPAAAGAGGGGGGGGGDGAAAPVVATAVPSLPMTSHPTSKPSRRDVASVQFSGPNAQYMAALARLFDAAQSIDQIARQVEDPGLRHADKTQVGLELCTRHAAEFFGFYICRFVLADLSLLLDKFLKRGGEWVLA